MESSSKSLGHGKKEIQIQTKKSDSAEEEIENIPLKTTK